MKQLTLCLLSILLVQTAYSQNTSGNSEALVRGTVYNQQDQTVPDASVALYDPAEDDLITGASSDSTGRFAIDVSPGSYLLEVSYISYQDYSETIELSPGETEDLGEITLRPTAEEMQQVVVEGERSHMEMSFDKRSFQVGSDLTSLGGTALDVLNNVPSVSTDIDGNISLRGNESVRVLINGKPSSMVSDNVDAMSSIPASMIKEVEIITNPSAQFSAEGSAGIINIILKKNRNLGFNGSVSAGTGFPRDHELSTNLNYRTDNVNWFFGGGVDYRRDPEEGRSFQRFSSQDTSYMYRETTDATESEIDANLRFGADIFLSENERLTADTYLELEDGRNDEDITYTDMSLGGDVLQRIRRDDNQDEGEKEFEFNLDYENRIAGDDHKLTAEASFDMGSETERSRLMETVTEGSADPLRQRTRNTEEEMDLRVEADYVRPLGGKSRLEAGVRTTFEQMDNSYRADELRNGSWQPLQQAFNDNFLYYENVNAAYATFGTEFGSFSAKVGLRAENTVIRTELKRTGDVSNQNYLDLFPSIFFNYEFDEQQSVQVSYSRRLSRPWSRMLLPFSDYSDSRSRFTGNPELEPEYSNSYEAGYLYYWGSGSLLTSFYYRHRTGVIERITTLDSEGITRIFPINLATEQAWGIELSGDQEIGNALTLTANANLFRSDSEGSYRGQTLTSEARILQGRLRVRWEITGQWNLQTSMRYEGPRSTTQGRREGMTMIDSGISRSLFDGRATVAFNVRDLLDSQNFEATINNPNYYSERQFSWSSRSFTLNFTYHFNRQEGNRDNRRRGGDWGDGF